MQSEFSKRESGPELDTAGGQTPVFGHLVRAQPRLFAYALTLLPDLDAAHDVLQQANCKLLENAEKFEANREFLPWACGAIRNEVLAYYRDRSRDKHVFSIDFVSRIAEPAEHSLDDDCHQSSLKVCYEKLTDHQRMLIDMRYGAEGSVAKMAQQLGRPPSSISTSLTKIRRILEDCVGRVVGSPEYE